MDFCFSKTSPIVETTKGKLRGFHFNGVDHFYGIRYAKAKRFQMPEPVDPWEGVKDAGSYGAICPVLSEPVPTGEVMIPHRFWPSSEHCQYLNVWTNSCDPLAKKPVLFWIHGGAFMHGCSSEKEFDGEGFEKKGIVMVSVNYRVNAFGFFAQPDLEKENPRPWRSGIAFDRGSFRRQGHGVFYHLCGGAG